MAMKIIEEVNNYLENEVLMIFYGQPIIRIYVTNGKKKNKCPSVTSVSKD